MSEQYTRPEKAAERAIARRVRAEVYADPCAHCLKRDVAFGEARCPTFGRTFPRCLSTPGLQFDLDHATLNRGKS